MATLGQKLGAAAQGTQAAQDTVADKTQSAKDILTPDEDDKSLAGLRTASGARSPWPLKQICRCVLTLSMSVA